MEDIESSINKVLDGTQIDGETTIKDVKNEITTKYSELESKQKFFSNKLLDTNMPKEQRLEYEDEIKKIREEFKKIVAEKTGYGIDAEIMTKIERQETLISDYLDELMDSDPETMRLYHTARSVSSPENIRRFHENPKIERLRQLHQKFGAFQNAKQEEKYIEFMFVGNPQMQEHRRHVATFHSLNNARVLQNAFGNPDDDFAKTFWEKGGIGTLEFMSGLADDQVEGVMKYAKSTLNGFGAMGYSAIKVGTHYPAEWTGKLVGKTLAWMQKKSDDKNWFKRTFKNLAKFPINLASVPAYAVLKPAEKVLEGAADMMGGELTTT